MYGFARDGIITSVPKLLHYSTLSFWTISFGRRNVKITSHLIVLELSLDAVILTSDFKDFHTAISANFGLSENEFLAP